MTGRLTATGVDAGYQRHRPVVRDVDLQLGAGEIVVVDVAEEEGGESPFTFTGNRKAEVPDLVPSGTEEGDQDETA